MKHYLGKAIHTLDKFPDTRTGLEGDARPPFGYPVRAGLLAVALVALVCGETAPVSAQPTDRDRCVKRFVQDIAGSGWAV